MLSNFNQMSIAINQILQVFSSSAELENTCTIIFPAPKQQFHPEVLRHAQTVV